MLRWYALFFLMVTSSLSYGMLNDWHTMDWSLTPQPKPLSDEERKQQEQDRYDTLLAEVQNKISNKQDLDETLASSIGAPKLLHRACSNGDAYLPITQLLISHGANTNVRNLNNSTPLHYVVSENALETVKLLLESNANPDITDTMFGTPLTGICRRAHDVLHDETIAKKRVQIVQLLLKHGANPNIKDEFQKSCLLHIITTPHEFLSGIDSLKDRNKALFFNQRKAIIRALLLYGAHLNAIDSKGITPIQAAYESDDSKNKPYFIELADYALNYARARLMSILGHSSARATHETPFKAFPKDIVNHIVKFTHPVYKAPTRIKTPATEKLNEN